MRNLLFVPFLALAAGCAAPSAQARRTVGVGSDGSVVGETRSALSGSTEGGPQELVGVYLPFGPFAVKAGLQWDGTPLIVNPVIPLAAPAPAALGACEAPRATVTRTVMVPETYYETETRQVPKTRMVPRQVVEPAAPVVLPKAAPQGCPEPVAKAGCENGCCAVAGR